MILKKIITNLKKVSQIYASKSLNHDFSRKKGNIKFCSRHSDIERNIKDVKLATFLNLIRDFRKYRFPSKEFLKIVRSEQDANK